MMERPRVNVNQVEGSDNRSGRDTAPYALFMIRSAVEGPSAARIAIIAPMIIPINVCSMVIPPVFRGSRAGYEKAMAQSQESMRCLMLETPQAQETCMDFLIERASARLDRQSQSER